MSQQTNVEPPQSPKIHLNSSADFDYLVSKWAIRVSVFYIHRTLSLICSLQKGWQNGCVAGLPVFLVSLAGRRMLPKSSQTLLERVLKVSWMSGAAGSASGGLIGYVRYRGMDRHELRKKRVEMQFAVCIVPFDVIAIPNADSILNRRRMFAEMEWLLSELDYQLPSPQRSSGTTPGFIIYFWEDLQLEQPVVLDLLS